LPKLRAVSGGVVIKILCNRFGFAVSGQSGSHVRLSKFTAQGKIGTVVPMHDELKLGTLKNILKLARVDPEEFSEFL
jgi:predicted RNA binding protein YcfA (HicA-like mRNA interferase family)